MSNYYSSSPLPHPVAWPQQRFHATKDPVTVRNEEEAAALGEGWSEKYIAKPYPKVKYKAKAEPKAGEPHYEATTVADPDAEGKLGSGWSDTVPPEPKEKDKENHTGDPKKKA